ncbi:glycerol-3-phosphate dehydrogenase [Terasakiella sp. A23]|uniref:glycerol-3-phosphate dehydrogenase n=1 Tax=Terasakiella sp. FCG-A23 TaxID=3080561 RepID=UPI002952D29B|nr:glycerol-3-phosphate dehydrogenase [Terasakiella sp. A23]MDV7341077.1 glycerol-3-phosphate dehydrogenase [Terasakiella sp. A23]
MNKDQTYDLFVIGGGINGCGIARDAAGRGLSVYLCEKDDLAQGTSSSSTKLIHGGLRYLEHYEFRLVRESLIEREVLLKNAPHIIWPLRFVLPHKKDMRPAWMLRLGLFIYDHLGGREILPGASSVDLRNDEAGDPLHVHFKKAFEYSDCWVDDARFVVLNAIDAKRLGAVIQTRTKCISTRRDGNIWIVEVEDQQSGKVTEIKAKYLVNASGPWVQNVMEDCNLSFSDEGVRLVRGSHIIVPKLYDHERAYIFQNEDGRIFFSIPYENDFTLIGTTDEDHKGEVNGVEISTDEIAYLCKSAESYFTKKITPADVVWSYSGVRPLYDDGASEAQEATRDYVLKDHGDVNNAPVLNIFGGKITTYRKLSEAALLKIAPYFPHIKPAWTKDAPLPGGEFDVSTVNEKIEQLRKEFSYLDKAWATRLVRMYGLRAWEILDQKHKKEDLGIDFGATLTETEVMFMINEEWATSVEDILWRRSKLGLHMTNAQKSILEEKVKTFLDAKQSAA